MHVKLRTPLRATLAAAAVAGGAFGIATVVSAQTASETPPPASAAAPVKVTPDARVLAHVAAFRDAFARGAASRRDGLSGQPTLELETATLPDGQPVSISTDSTRVCISYLPRGAVGPGGACDTAATASAAGLYTSTQYSNGDVDVAGLVPDGTSEVELSGAAGAARVVPVQANTYATTLAFAPASIRFTTTAGPVTRQLK